jgi:DNA recombination protein RmuC
MAIETSFLLGLLAGFFIATVIFWLFMVQKNRQNASLLSIVEQDKKQLSQSLLDKTAHLAALGERIGQAERLVDDLSAARASLGDLKDENGRLMAKVAGLEMENQKTAEFFNRRITDLSSVHDQMREAFASVSQDALLKNADMIKNSFNQSMEHYFKVTEKDRSMSQELLANIMKPLKESLVLVDTKVGELESKRQGAYDGLREQIEGLLKSQATLQKETQTLSRALHAPTIRGHWGEMQLKRVVELSGLSAHCDFVEQKSIKEGDDVLRPDMIVTLPKNKKIVIDAKAPLEFLADVTNPSMFEVNEEERGQLLAASLRRHLLALKKKSYYSALGESPEFVVMFLPGEAFLHWALIADPMLLDFAAQNEILITTPITLVALLKSIAFGFGQEAVANNIEEVRKLSQQLIDRVNKVSEHFERLGKCLKQSTEAYNQTLASLDSRVLVTARKLANIRSISKDTEELTVGHLPLLEVMPRMVDFKADDGEQGA